MPVGIRRLVSVSLVSLCALVGGLVFGSALALASAPETPEKEKASAITATTATLEGVLNPKATGAVEGGEYEFEYRVSESECEGENDAPEPGTGIAAGLPAEPKSVNLTGLQPHQKYTFCLVERNAASEVAKGVPVTFETEAAKPTVESETTALPVKATEATLEAQVNPNNESTTYRFEYSTSATGETLNAPVTTLASATVLGGFGNQTASVATGPALTQDTTYYYRVVATNKTGTSEGTVAHFKTAIAPETPEKLEAEPIGPITATLKGVLNPNTAGEVGTYEFAYRRSASECQRENPETHLRENENATTPGSSSTTSPQPVSAPVTELLPGAQYTFCLIAHNSADETTISSPVTFTTLPAAPMIVSESASSVESTGATLNAQIDPDGAATSYHFEYGTTESYGQRTPEAALTGLTGTETAAARITSLQPGTTYHYRVVASNECEAGKACVTDGQDKTLITPPPLGAAPPQHCENEKLRLEQPYGVGLPDCRAYEMVSPVETNGNDATDPGFYQGLEAVAPVAAVSGEAIAYTSAGSFAHPKGSGTQNEFLSRRGLGGWSTQDIVPLRVASKAEAFFSSYKDAIFTPELTEGVTDTNAQLTSEAPPWEVEKWGLYVDDFASGSYRFVGEIVWSVPTAGAVGASIDLSHVVFGEDGDLSEWVNGKILPVGVAPDGEGITAYTEGLHAVSSDGSRVFFSSQGQVYVRENAEREQSALGTGGECVEASKACTVAISGSAARFWGASADGSEAFFAEGEELEQYDVESAQTIALGNTVQGVVQISEDGSYVYFVAKGALKGAGGATLRNGGGAEPVAGEDNLYLAHEGATQFVATLAGNDSDDWTLGLAEDNGVVAPGGARLAFMSEQSLTGYDNEQSEPGECERSIGKNGLGPQETGRCQELYLYDAKTGGLECASCNPTGARPIGRSTLSASVPAPRESQHRPRALVEDGALFFDSSDALGPHASDGLQNVYEYEDGYVYAISNVAGGYESFFLDASASGNDVFFATADQLLPEDVSNNVVVYDARVDGGFPATVSPRPCDNGDACKPPPAPQSGVFGAPASATFSGAGNIPPTSLAATAVRSAKKVVRCAKGRKLTRGKCVRKKTTKKRKAKKSSHGKESN